MIPTQTAWQWLCLLTDATENFSHLLALSMQGDNS